MRFPAYEQWRLVTFGHFLEHTDFLSIYQWLAGAFIRISLGMFLIPDLLNIPKSNKRTVLLIVLFILMIAASQIRVSDQMFMKFLSAVYLPYSLLIALILSALFVSVALLHNKRKVKL